MNKPNFIAFDFETATTSRMPCQLGIVVVRGGKIVEEKQWLIKPPDNKYDRQCTKVHGTSAKDTENSHEFSELWNEIKPYFHHEVIVSHNMHFDLDVLDKIIKHYQLDDIIPLCYEDTCRIYLNQPLECVMQALKLNFDNHHNALCDARACALVFLEFLNGIAPNELDYPQKEKRQRTTFNKFSTDYAISAEAKQQDLSCVENSNTIFYNKICVISGTFEHFPIRNDLAVKLKKLGADINSSISRKTDFIIVGSDFGPSKMEKVKELQANGEKIKILTEEELLKNI